MDRLNTLTSLIDHTILSPEASWIEVRNAANVAAELECASVCVSPTRVLEVCDYLVQIRSSLPICTVVGFPSGAHDTVIKAAEAARAVSQGAQEIDMVVNLAMINEADWDGYKRDIESVRLLCDETSKGTQLPIFSPVLKVIIETALWNDRQITDACKIAMDAGADFVKTSTGLHKLGGATQHAVEVMANAVQGQIGVKASGGIRTLEQVLGMLDAGATRIGIASTESLAPLTGYTYQEESGSASTEPAIEYETNLRVLRNYQTNVAVGGSRTIWNMR